MALPWSTASNASIFVNDAFARLFGFARGSELQGKAWRRLYDGGQIRRFDVEVLPKLSPGIGGWAK